MFQTTNQIEVHLLLAATVYLKWVLRQNWSSVDPTCGEMAQIPVKNKPVGTEETDVSGLKMLPSGYD